MSLSLIVAMDQNGVIGRDGDLPWRLSADLRRFKQITMGHSIVMGRKTFDSIGRLLPGRETIIVTRNSEFQFKGATVVHRPEDVSSVVANDSEAFIIGGAEIYRQMLPLVDRLYLTRVEATVEGGTVEGGTVEGDTVFPEVDWTQWDLVEQESHPADDKNDFNFRFEVHQRSLSA